jgi:flagellar motility protein MotE (MotC chaperone)
MTPHRAAAAILLAALMCPVPASVAASPSAEPGGTSMSVQTKKVSDLAERERTLKADEERLLVLRKEVDVKIATYEKLLGQAEEKQKRKKEEKDASVDQLVKLFEGMSPEGAAARLAALDDGMAAAILGKMKSRKASAALSVMDPRRVAVIALKIVGGVKNFPAE